MLIYGKLSNRQATSIYRKVEPVPLLQLVSLSCDDTGHFHWAVTRSDSVHCLFTGPLTDLDLEEHYPESMVTATFETEGYLDLRSGSHQPRYTDQGPDAGFAKYGDEELWSLDPSGYNCGFDGLGNLVLTPMRSPEPASAATGYGWCDPRYWLPGMH